MARPPQLPETGTKNYAGQGQPSDPQERGRPGHDGQPQPPEAKPPTPADLKISTTDDPADHDPVAGEPVPASDPGHPRDNDERLLKPVLRGSNNRTGGG
jgi:hypothetical protein